eukprot:COSAG02_NODE_243_length_27457_cov_16.852328_4_plen_679_part_00
MWDLDETEQQVCCSHTCGLRSSCPPCLSHDGSLGAQAKEIERWAKEVSTSVTHDSADLPDIVAAFEACDVDGDNRISASELHAVLVAIGATVTPTVVKEQIKRVKAATPADDDASLFAHDSAEAAAGGGSEYGMDAAVGIVVRRKWLTHRKHRKKIAARARYAERDYAALALGAHSNLAWYKRHHEEERNKLLGDTNAHGLQEEAGQEESIEAATNEDELSDEEFVRFIRGPYLEQYFSDEDWRSRVREIRNLRRAYDVADVDGDNHMQRGELELVLAALRPHDPPSPEEVDRLWYALVPRDKDVREVRRLFAEYDEDTSGTINSEELERILDELVFDRGRFTTKNSSRRVVAVARAQAQLKVVAKEELLRFDSTGRGELNCDEVLQLYRSCLERDEVSAAAKLQSESLTWEDFLRGLPTARADPEVGHMLSNLARPNEWELVSLLIDIKTSQETADHLEDGLSFFEKIGNRTLKWLTPENLNKDELRDTLRQACAGELHVLEDSTRHKIRRHKRNMGLTACLIGFVCNMFVAMIENYAMWTTGNSGIWENYYMCNNVSSGDGIIGDWPPYVPGCDTCGWPEDPVECQDCQDCEVAGTDKILKFIAIDGLSVAFWMGTELLLLGLFAVNFACRIATEYKYRLYPLNPERAFVANALIRPCFEMGNSKSPVYSQSSDPC